MCTVPPVLKPRVCDIWKVSMTTPCPAKAASPWMQIGTTRSPVVSVAPILSGAHRSLDHRRDDFQVGRIERERQVHLAAGGHDVRGEALVVLDVTGAWFGRQLALELVEQLARVSCRGC